MPLKNRSNERVWALDGLRGLAAIAVVAYHYLYRAGELYPDEIGAPEPWIQWGSYGVQLFFLISGYVVFNSARNSSTSRFLFNRAVRIYPAFWVCAIIVLIVISFFGLEGRDSLTATETAINFTLTQGFLNVPYLDGAWWTLTVELLFYLQIALLARFGFLSDRKLPITLFAWLFITVGIRFAVATSGIVIVEHLSGILYWTPAFLIGIGVNLARSGRPLLGVSLTALSLASMAPGNLTMIVPMVCATGLLILAVVLPLPRRLRGASSYLGELSYPLYLLHQNVGYVLLLAFAAWGLPRYAGVLITFCIVASVATAIAYIIDRPLRRYLRMRYDIATAQASMV